MTNSAHSQLDSRATDSVPDAPSPAMQLAQAGDTVELRQPEAGTTVVLHVDPGQILHFDFSPADAQAAVTNGNLQLTFENHGSIIVHGYAAWAAVHGEATGPQGGEVDVARLIGQSPEATAQAAPQACEIPNQQVVDVPMPAAGERVVVEAHAGDALRLGCEFQDVKGSQVGHTLELTFPNGGVAAIGNFDQWVAEKGATVTDCKCGGMNLADFIIALGMSPENVLPAAGPQGGPQGVDHPQFAVTPAQSLLGGYPYPNILPGTSLDYTTPQPQNDFLPILTGEGLPTVEVPTGTTVNEAGLPPHDGKPAGSGEELAPGPNGDPSETTTGAITFTEGHAPAVITINGTPVTGVIGQTIAGDFGTLTITGIHGDPTIDYSYTLATNTSGDDTHDDFTVVVTDKDGNTASNTLQIGIVDDMPTAHDDVGSVDEAALPTGSHPSPTAVTTTGNLLANDIQGADGAVIASISGHTPDASGHIVIDSASGHLDVNSLTGAYTYTLEHAGPATQDVFDYVLQDGDGDTSNAKLTIDIASDLPDAVNDTATTVDTNPQDVNLVVVFDRSGSMADNPGVAGYSTRMELAKAAVAALFEAYQSVATDLHIKIVDFSTTAANSVWLSSPQEANAYLAQAEALGSTNYAGPNGAIPTLIDNYNTASDPAPAADRTELYFISDGQPNPPTTGLGGGTSIVGTAQWESFLTANHIENSFAIGVGAGLNPDDPNLGAVSFPNGPGGTEPNRILVTDESQLLATLIGTVTNPVSGNVLDNDVFGADGKGNGGVGLVSIDVGGHTYTYDQTTNEIRNESNAVVVAGAILVVDTPLGGHLIFHFDTGAYTYVSPNVTATETETFHYTINNASGQSSGADLQITVTDAGHNLDVPHTHIGTNGDDNFNDSAVTVDNIMSGGLGSDTLIGGLGNDHIQGGTSNDSLAGGAGDDILLGGQTNNDHPGSSLPGVPGGNDTLDGGLGHDSLFGGDGDDKLFIGTGDEGHGGSGNDLLILQDNTGFGLVDGGTNTSNDLAVSRGDVLAFDDHLDLTSLDNSKVTGIETVSMIDSEGGGSHLSDTLTLNASDVIDLGTGHFHPSGSFGAFGPLPDKDTVRVDGDGPNDTVNLAGGGWTQVTGSHGAPAGYNLYVHDAGGGHADSYALVQSTLTVHTS